MRPCTASSFSQKQRLLNFQNSVRGNSRVFYASQVVTIEKDVLYCCGASKMGLRSVARVTYTVKKDRHIWKGQGCKSYTEKNPVGIFSLFYFPVLLSEFPFSGIKIFCSSPSSFLRSIVLIKKSIIVTTF